MLLFCPDAPGMFQGLQSLIQLPIGIRMSSFGHWLNSSFWVSWSLSVLFELVSRTACSFFVSDIQCLSGSHSDIAGEMAQQATREHPTRRYIWVVIWKWEDNAGIHHPRHPHGMLLPYMLFPWLHTLTWLTAFVIVSKHSVHSVNERLNNHTLQSANPRLPACVPRHSLRQLTLGWADKSLFIPPPAAIKAPGSSLCGVIWYGLHPAAASLPWLSLLPQPWRWWTSECGLGWRLETRLQGSSRFSAVSRLATAVPKL